MAYDDRNPAAPGTLTGWAHKHMFGNNWTRGWPGWVNFPHLFEERHSGDGKCYHCARVEEHGMHSRQCVIV